MPLTTKNQLTITGVPDLNAKRFTINIGLGEQDYALHFDVRFDHQGDHRTIVLNSKHNGKFNSEKKEKHFFFQETREFKVTITFTHDEFQVKIPDDYPVSFPNSFGEDEFKFIQVHGDLRIKSFNID
uniref:Galectin n=1 Tax=Paramormyrops kingsleyae TaxID=1676925 RepID=A0A3B3RTK8_9TELE